MPHQIPPTTRPQAWSHDEEHAPSIYGPIHWKMKKEAPPTRPPTTRPPVSSHDEGNAPSVHEEEKKEKVGTSPASCRWRTRMRVLVDSTQGAAKGDAEHHAG